MPTRSRGRKFCKMKHVGFRGAHSGLKYRIEELITAAETKAARDRTEQKWKAQQVRTRTLMLDFAAHAHELDKSHRPASASDLVPTYLKSVPIDPVTGKEMKLTP